MKDFSEIFYDRIPFEIFYGLDTFVRYCSANYFSKITNKSSINGRPLKSLSTPDYVCKAFCLQKSLEALSLSLSFCFFETSIFLPETGISPPVAWRTFKIHQHLQHRNINKFVFFISFLSFNLSYDLRQLCATFLCFLLDDFQICCFFFFAFGMFFKLARGNSATPGYRKNKISN